MVLTEFIPTAAILYLVVTKDFADSPKITRHEVNRFSTSQMMLIISMKKQLKALTKFVKGN